MILHISTCPNDTFMFDALLHGRVDTEGLEFDVNLADIEELNALALKGIADVTKCSYAIVPEINYEVLNSGSALGRGNGPLMVSKNAEFQTVAIPGEHTTANLLLKKLFPEITEKKVMLFSEIIPAIVDGTVDAGVLIHEGRFIYKEHGLRLIADLGVEWGKPLPLGAIAVRKTLPEETKMRIDRVLRRSVEYALNHPDASRTFVKKHAQEMDDAVIRQHIDLFVNEFSVDLGTEGRETVEQLLGAGDYFVRNISNPSP